MARKLRMQAELEKAVMTTSSVGAATALRAGASVLARPQLQLMDALGPAHDAQKNLAGRVLSSTGILIREGYGVSDSDLSPWWRRVQQLMLEAALRECDGMPPAYDPDRWAAARSPCGGELTEGSNSILDEAVRGLYRAFLMRRHQHFSRMVSAHYDTINLILQTLKGQVQYAEAMAGTAIRACSALPSEIGCPPDRAAQYLMSLAIARAIGNLPPALAEFYAGCNMPLRTERGNMLHMAVETDYESCAADSVTLLLQAGIDPDAPTESTRKTALMLAAQHARPQLLRMLIEAGANPDAKDRRGWTARHYLNRRNQGPGADECRAYLDALRARNALRSFVLPSLHG